MLHRLLLLSVLITVALSADPLSYCKCTCGTQSIIIPIDHDDPKALTCLDCNRQFCRSSNLNICDDAKEEEISTTCFQRDSVKDQTVVLIFIFATVGLLVYAAAKPFVQQWLDKRRTWGSYDPLPAGG